MFSIQVRVFESHCGSLTQYGMKHMRAFANICNNGVSKEAMEDASIGACGGYNFEKWSPLSHGYSAWWWSGGWELRFPILVQENLPFEELCEFWVSKLKSLYGAIYYIRVLHDDGMESPCIEEIFVSINKITLKWVALLILWHVPKHEAISLFWNTKSFKYIYFKNDRMQIKYIEYLFIFVIIYFKCICILIRVSVRGLLFPLELSQ